MRKPPFDGGVNGGKVWRHGVGPEGRGRCPALPAPVLPLGGQQGVAERGAQRPAGDVAFVEALARGDENVAAEVRHHHEHDLSAGEARRVDRFAVDVGGPRLDRIAQNRAQPAQSGQRLLGRYGR